MAIKWSGAPTKIQSCVDRILQGETFRNSPSSRRLLKYLVDHSLAGDADKLKEYTIGVDAFHKTGDYDPRLDSTVRIQIGRLGRAGRILSRRRQGRSARRRLAEGHFSLICEPRSAPMAATGSPEESSGIRSGPHNHATVEQSLASRNAGARWIVPNDDSRRHLFLLKAADRQDASAALWSPTWMSCGSHSSTPAVPWSSPLVIRSSAV